jgi:hypothetical protein
VILQPGILALLLGAMVSLSLLSCGAVLGLRIACQWRPAAADARQLQLERQSYLAATLVQWAIAFEFFSLPLFVYTAEQLHPLFVGAMCATGTLNANPIGWHLLWMKMLLFVGGGLWWVVNRLDLQVPEAPLTKAKFLALLALLPLCIADLVVMIRYFSGLQPEVITSCCGALFGTQGKGVANEMAALPMRPVIIAFYASAAVMGGALLLCRRFPWKGLRAFLAIATVNYGVITLVSMVTFISVYYYRLPNHHCPFDLLQGHYYFIGYPLYACLFGSLLCGFVPQVLTLLQSHHAFGGRLRAIERRWINAGLCLLAGMLALVSWPLMFGEFTLKAYM